MRPLALAWRQLIRQKFRLCVAVAGVSFAVVLIFMQLGFREALFQSSTRFHGYLDGELFLVSPQFSYLVNPNPFPRRRVHQARSFPGVDAASPIYLSPALWKNPFSGKQRDIFVVGSDPTDDVLAIPGVRAQLDSLRRPDVALFDEASRSEYGAVAEELRRGRTVSVEVLNRRITVIGLFEMGTSFGIDGTIITSDLNYLRMFPSRGPGLVHIGVIQLDRDADPIAVRDAMRSFFPNDVLVLTKDEFVSREQDYWETSTPIGYVFTFGVVMGLVVGGIIVYQILFADVSEHLAEYATLKAMGYSDAYLFSVVFCQAVLLAVLGYGPGFASSIVLYRIAASATRLPLQMNVEVCSFVLALTILMCCVSGGLALRKIRSADPAEIF